MQVEEVGKGENVLVVGKRGRYGSNIREFNRRQDEGTRRHRLPAKQSHLEDLRRVSTPSFGFCDFVQTRRVNTHGGWHCFEGLTTTDHHPIRRIWPDRFLERYGRSTRATFWRALHRSWLRASQTRQGQAMPRISPLQKYVVDTKT